METLWCWYPNQLFHQFHKNLWNGQTWLLNKQGQIDIMQYKLWLTLNINSFNFDNSMNVWLYTYGTFSYVWLGDQEDVEHRIVTYFFNWVFPSDRWKTQMTTRIRTWQNIFLQFMFDSSSTDQSSKNDFYSFEVKSFLVTKVTLKIFIKSVSCG